MPVASQQDNYGHWRVDGVLHWCVCSQVLTMAGRMGPPGNKLGALALFDMAEWERSTPLISAYDIAGASIPFFSRVVEEEAFGGGLHVIWLHGLGDEGADFRFLERELAETIRELAEEGPDEEKAPDLLWSFHSDLAYQHTVSSKA